MNNKNLLLVVNLLLLLFLAVYFLSMSRNIEELSNNDKIEMMDWWKSDDLESKEIFEKIFSGVFTDYDKIRIYNGAVGTEVGQIVKHPRILNVQYSAESYYKEPDAFDINFIPSEQNYKNIIAFPYGSLYFLTKSSRVIERLTKPRTYQPKSNFCLFSVTNGSCQQRNEMFSELCKYKKVDSCGQHMNNMDKPCPGNWWEEEYCQFISQYKFMICFENVSKCNYLTEKCINAFYCGTIPIYWGCTNVDEHINREAILYLSPEYTSEEREALIQKIIYLDNNEEAYRSMFEKPFFKDGVLPPSFDINQIREKIENTLQ